MENSNNREVVILRNADELAEEAARRFELLAKGAIERIGRFTVALSGGNTPQKMHTLLAGEPYASRLDWKHIYVFFSDERNVPPDHADSNYRSAHEALLGKIALPPENIFRMRGEEEAAKAAAEYDNVVQKFFRLSQIGGPSPDNYPRFDLIFLGMGADGHTASLFPGTAALQERSKPVTANYVPKLDTQRITFTAPTINRAANVIFLIAGADKVAPLYEVMEGEYQPQTYPAQLVRPSQGQLTFLLDEAAAAQLKK